MTGKCHKWLYSQDFLSKECPLFLLVTVTPRSPSVIKGPQQVLEGRVDTA